VYLFDIKKLPVSEITGSPNLDWDIMTYARKKGKFSKRGEFEIVKSG